MLFVEGHHVGRAHAPLHLSAGALAVALLGRAGQAAVRPEIEVRSDRERARIWPKAEIFAESWRVDDLSRVKQSFRVESLFDLAEGLREAGTKNALGKNATQNAVAVLAAQAAAKLQYQICYTGCNLIH